MNLDAIEHTDDTTMAPAATQETWRDNSLHAWETIVLLFGKPRPAKPNAKVSKFDDAHRETYIREQLDLAAGLSRNLESVIGTALVVDDRLVLKLSAPEYNSRAPYITWLPNSPVNAVEVWQREVHSDHLGALEARTYFLMPVNDDRDYDGYVVITGADNVVFTAFPFEARYANGSLRIGKLLFKSYADSVLCSESCCEELVAARREAGILRDKNRLLEQRLRSEQKATRAANLKVERLEKRLRAPQG